MTAPQTFPYAPPSPFASQIPIEQTRLSHALHSEWTKIRTVRSTMWTLGVMLFLVIGINLLVVIPISDSNDTTVPVLAAGLFGLMLGQLAIITLGVLVITSEYGTGMIRTTFTSCPQRSRVLAAKAIVFFGLSFVTTTVACTVTALVSWSVVGGKTWSPGEGTQAGVVIRNGVTTASAAEWLGATVGVGLYVALLGLLALAVGTLLRHSAGAITTMLGVVLLPLLVAIFLPDSLASARDGLIRFSSPNSLASLYRIPMIGSDNQNGVLQLIVLACITAAALTAAFITLNTRDV
ncbi:ABC-2 type transport system permease protein [Streptomyces sp. DvalAA-14]|uniref:ABC transporter permease subunit n=1 Tax=unclassified Streptomyces TaxID=2593676 RepID=UPI00081BA061|nr:MULTISPECIES: ABC transporter permease subunit [unclassified Streptomyces]MYS20758.1 ABC transporter permease subunit [Streptomyces sp. SID4948]SCD76650.1 ABC-2 type transport system permease protein [Streptomyces sp. DvalAA-14]